MDLTPMIEDTVVTVILTVTGLVISAAVAWLTPYLTAMLGAERAKATSERGVIVAEGMARSIARVAASMAVGKTKPEEAVDMLEAYARTQWSETVGTYFDDRASLRTFVLGAVVDGLETQTGLNLGWVEEVVERFDPKQNVSHLPMPSPQAVGKAVGGVREAVAGVLR